MDERGVRRTEIIAVLSLASDLAMGQPLGFGLRLCLAGLDLAGKLGLDAEQRAGVYYHGLLRHAGCTAETDRLAALFGDEIALRQNVAPIDFENTGQLLPVIARRVQSANADKAPLVAIGAMVAGLLRSRSISRGVFVSQCEAAGRLAQRLGLPGTVSRDLGQIHERWDGRGVPHGLKGDGISQAVRIVAVLQDALTLTAVLPANEAMAVLEERAGTLYDPRVVAQLADNPGVLRDESAEVELWARVAARSPDGERLAGEDLDRAIEVIGDFIDLKAPAIAGHSRAVAVLARDAATRAGLDGAATIYRVGLLHDLGYAAVPAATRLAIPGEQGRLHPYYGERLLSWSADLAPLGRMVGEHHERLDGSGFHRGARAPELSLPGRLVAAAEAYQSMVEDRPFRVTLRPAEAASRLREAVRAGTLDGTAVAAVLNAAGVAGIGKQALPGGLTAREADILCRIAVGTPVKTIARQLGISPKTVGNHVQNLYGKIGVTTRAGATLFAIETGLLRPGTRP